MDDVKQSAVCSDCGIALPSPEGQEKQLSACPKCGSTKQTVRLEIFETVDLSIHDNVKGKVREGPGKKGVKKEFFAGDDHRKSKDDWVDKQRVIDRENDRYQETVKDKKTGELIHHCDEPLSEHWGHGSAKFRNEDPT